MLPNLKRKRKEKKLAQKNYYNIWTKQARNKLWFPRNQTPLVAVFFKKLFARKEKTMSHFTFVFFSPAQTHQAPRKRPAPLRR
ncbi:hypothetical protein COX69_04480 [Candidatus Falkowbacteria bacterium CG_4_10_14_0_2_um_filter_48_10]|uniref:Uncharacterized protein n=1 Tax=Candidatus Falkowbacteria bacterium CG23_combo_of_CG06-09_8_20_14_all_49_15 TaxID=1974572 RepID=A0A2G9ZNJ8_9BACT|nr:MAG: hypothetical protein COX22_01835 [Candidatus Falkowbacteria bacterium CG23_combo_of_CG06-09_8_20_14_all_49_15]PJA07551.1 MAG: hypothetical protein COX69_04480 [Candidatus Falkowbacteria bacterium CG_4_10_14_0_2_um_filter_48_10]